MTSTGLPLILRRLKAQDRPAWQRLWHSYLDFYGTNVSEDVTNTTFARLMGDDPQDFSCIVAELDGRLVGLTHYLFHRHNWRVENVCYLQDLYADKSVRGRGIGRALIEAVYGAADKVGSPGVYWMTQQTNLTAMQLYDRIATKTDFITYRRPAA